MVYYLHGNDLLCGMPIVYYPHGFRTANAIRDAGTAKLSDENLLFIFFHPTDCFNKNLGGLAPVLEDNVGTGPHSKFCLCRMDDGIQHYAFVDWTKNNERWVVVDVSTFQMVVSR
ncbi:hypothetical protein HELRODRAFT_160531 [Helobdella robusta]|uniref:Uncharacterized protein n=1 Tax=Helobdella robusta TaxID=6412 RepID=T1EQD2_HELRO|nr:hypothetical protein HELRODRAFT_160531 [Helobdella robusta]ESO06364.1 hypothetical protein HELRODRAFT_160531 [Helobdella robusta]